MKPIRIAVTGPESTGKSWLTEHLAEHYNAQWVPEYAREYLKHNRSYQAEDVVKIAKGQMKLEKELLKSNPGLIFADTELLVCKIWLDFVFGQQNEFIERSVKDQQYDLYLLCNIDLKWEPDPLREHPDQRETLFHLYEKWLLKLNFPYRIITGTGNERLKNAINFVDQLLQS